MSPEQDAVVRNLERCIERSAQLGEMTHEEQLSLLSERQTVLDAVQAFDTSAWSADDKKRVGQLLQQLLQHTEAAAALVQAQVEALTESRQQVAHGREALRGYRPDMKRSSRTVNRTA